MDFWQSGMIESLKLFGAFETLKLSNQKSQETTQIQEANKKKNKKPKSQETFFNSKEGYPHYPSTYRLQPLHPTTLLGDMRELGGHELIVSVN